MDLFNRIVTVILLALLCIAAGYAAVVTLRLQLDPALVGHFIVNLFDPFAQIEDPARRYTATVICSVVSLLSLYVLLLELNPNPKQRRPLLVQEVPLGRDTIDRNSVRVLVARTLMNFSSIRDVDVRLRTFWDAEEGLEKLQIYCRILATHTTIMTELGPQVRDEVKERIEAQLGLSVGEVSTLFRFEPPEPKKRPLL